MACATTSTVYNSMDGRGDSESQPTAKDLENRGAYSSRVGKGSRSRSPSGGQPSWRREGGSRAWEGRVGLGFQRVPLSWGGALGLSVLHTPQPPSGQPPSPSCPKRAPSSLHDFRAPWSPDSGVGRPGLNLPLTSLSGPPFPHLGSDKILETSHRPVGRLRTIDTIYKASLHVHKKCLVNAPMSSFWATANTWAMQGPLKRVPSPAGVAQ